MKRTSISNADKRSDAPKAKRAVSTKKAPGRSAKSKSPREAKTDWATFDALTDTEVRAAATTDPDNRPLTKKQLAKMQRPNLARRVRFELGLSQLDFSDRYELPIGSIRDWEQGRCEMDAATTGYYIAIAADPEGVHRARKKAKFAA